MKIGIFGESDTNEAAIEVLVGAILHRRVQRIGGYPILSRGFGSVLSLTPKVVQHFYYRTDAEALVIVCDSDDTPPHDAAHNSNPDPDCRFCKLRPIVLNTLKTLRPSAGREPPRVAVGLAVPAIEAWYLCGTPHSAHETSYLRMLREGARLYVKRRELKKLVYGAESPSKERERTISLRECQRLSADIESLRRNFPGGFGTFYDEIATWR